MAPLRDSRGTKKSSSDESLEECLGTALRSSQCVKYSIKAAHIDVNVNVVASSLPL